MMLVGISELIPPVLRRWITLASINIAVFGSNEILTIVDIRLLTVRVSSRT